MTTRAPFEIGGQQVPAGTRALVDLPVSKLSNHTPVTLPVHVVHGREGGQTMFVSAAVHGDELNGVEIIRRVLDGATGAPRDVVLLNAGAALFVAGRANTIVDGIRVAAAAIDSGTARTTLDRMVRASQGEAVA